VGFTAVSAEALAMRGYWNRLNSLYNHTQQKPDSSTPDQARYLFQFAANSNGSIRFYHESRGAKMLPKYSRCIERRTPPFQLLSCRRNLALFDEFDYNVKHQRA